MGRLIKPPLGKLSGKAGNIVGRDFGYDHYISVRPKKYTVKKKLKEVSSKQRFHTAVQLAKTIVRFPDLKEVWDKCNMPGKRGYNRIISANYKFLKDNLPTTENIITPKGRELILDMLEVNNKMLQCTYDMGGLIKPRFCLTSIILFYNPIKTNFGLNFITGDRFFVEPEYADRAMDKKGEKYISKYYFDDKIKLKREQFRNAILYIAVVGTSTSKNKKWWTSTVAIDITGFKLRFLYLPRDEQRKDDKGRQKINTLRNTYPKKYKKQQC
jgi:hypothetical protein